jgi:hypothetical protein
VLRQLAQQQELEPGQGDRALPDVGDQACDVQRQATHPDDLTACGRVAAEVGVLAQPDPDPGQQLSQGERLGQVVLRAAFQAADLGGYVGHARQHHHRLVRAGLEQLVEYVPAVHVRHDQVQDDQVVVAFEGLLQSRGSARGEGSEISGRRQGPADERTDVGFVIDDENPLRCPALGMRQRGRGNSRVRGHVCRLGPCHAAWASHASG